MDNNWHSSACILCENNCGIKVQLGGEQGREIVRIRGDEEHPASAGYLCQKASGLNHYQNGRDRITTPLKRQADGSFAPIPWDQACREIMDRFTAIRDQHGGDKIFYYGGGGQGNHLPGAFAVATRAILGSRYRSNALAQEKTGEFWVNAQMFGHQVRGDFEHCDVAFFIGKNPWQSHGVPRARAFLKDLHKDPKRHMIVVDPVLTETAKLADIHLRVRPGTDAWLLTALVAQLIQSGNLDDSWLQDHTEGLEQLREYFLGVDAVAYAAMAGISETQLAETLALLKSARGLAVFEDLGVQMNRHSSLNSYLEKLLWVLLGHFGVPGGQNIPAQLQNVAGSGRVSGATPVTHAPIISGLVPCNVIAEEILNDHPDRFRAMLIEAANPVHSLAGSDHFRKALRSLDLTVVIDIAMTETASEADYVLPAATQYEKWEATFFNFELHANYFHLRKPLFAALGDSLPEAEIHARLIEASADAPVALVAKLKQVAESDGPQGVMEALLGEMGQDSSVARMASYLLYRSLGPLLPDNAREAAVLLPLALQFAGRESESLARAGYAGDPVSQALALFDAMTRQHSGVVFARDTEQDSWRRLGPDRPINLVIPPLLAELEGLSKGPETMTSSQYPFVLSAGERRDYSANTIYRGPEWRRKDRTGALRINPEDAKSLGVQDNEQLRVTSEAGTAITCVQISDRMMPGHLSLPNGFGLDNANGERSGVAVNELTSPGHRDKFAGTPFHKSVAVRLERVES